MPCAEQPAVAIVLVNWNGWRHAVECIDSLLAQRYENFHVYLVDNDSADRSIENIAAWCEKPHAEAAWPALEGVERMTRRAAGKPITFRIVNRPDRSLERPAAGCRLTLIRSGGNLGFAGGCNVGMSAAGLDAFDYFWFLNSDTVVHVDALLELVRRAESDPSTGIVGSTLRYYAKPAVVQAFGGCVIDPQTGTVRRAGGEYRVAEIPPDGAAVEAEITYIYGASMLASRRYVRDVGPLQEDYFLYYEEADWAIRGRAKFALGYAPKSHVFHKSGASSAKKKPLLSLRYYYRNRIRFICRFYPAHLASAKRHLCWEAVRYVLKTRWSKARIVAEVVRDCALIEAQVRGSASMSEHVAARLHPQSGR